MSIVARESNQVEAMKQVIAAEPSAHVEVPESVDVDAVRSTFKQVFSHINDAFQRGDLHSTIDSTPGAEISEMIRDAAKQLRYVERAKEVGVPTDQVQTQVLGALAKIIERESRVYLDSKIVGVDARDLSFVQAAIEKAVQRDPKTYSMMLSRFDSLVSKDGGSLSDDSSEPHTSVSPRAQNGGATSAQGPGGANPPAPSAGAPSNSAGQHGANNAAGGAGGAGTGGGRGTGGPGQGGNNNPNQGPNNPGPNNNGGGRFGTVGAPQPNGVPVAASVGNQLTQREMKAALALEGHKVLTIGASATAGGVSGVLAYLGLNKVVAFLNLKAASNPVVAKTIPALAPGVATLFGGWVMSKAMDYAVLRSIRKYTDKLEGPLKAAMSGVKTPEGFFEAIKESAQFAFERTGMSHISARALALLNLTTSLTADLAIERALKRAAQSPPAEQARLVEQRYRVFREHTRAAANAEGELFEDMSPTSTSPSPGAPQSLRERHFANLAFIRDRMVTINPGVNLDPLFQRLESAEIGGFNAFTPGRTTEWFRLVLGRNLGEYRKEMDPSNPILTPPKGIASDVFAAAIEFERLLLGRPEGRWFRREFRGGVVTDVLTPTEAASFGVNEGSSVRAVWDQLTTVESRISSNFNTLCKGLLLRHRVMAETLLGDSYNSVDASGNPTPGYVPSLTAATDAPIQVETVSSNPDPRQRAIEDANLRRRANSIKSILIHTAIESTQIMGKSFTDGGNSGLWLDFVRANPNANFKTPALNLSTGEPQLDRDGNIVVVPMTGADIIALYDDFYSNGLTDQGRAVWSMFLNRVDGTSLQALREQAKAEDVINPLIERVMDGRENPRYNNPVQKLYDIVVRRLSGNSISWTIEPGMGNIEINNGRIMLASYLEGMKKTLRHYDIFNLENEMTRETVVNNLAREATELLNHMARRKQEYQGTVIERPSLAETMFNRYNPLYRMAQSFLEHTFTKQPGVTSFATKFALVGVGVGIPMFGWYYAGATATLVVGNFFVSSALPAVKRWFGTASKSQSA